MENDNPLAIFETGNPAGLPVILIHGGAGGVWTWLETTKHLMDFRCIMPELPEHGGSSFKGRFTIRATALRIINDILKNLPERTAHLVGLSVGAQVAIDILACEPELPASAMLSGALVLPPPGYKLGLYSETVMGLLYGIGVKPWKNNDFWIRMTMKYSAGIPAEVFKQYKRNFQSLTLSGWKHAMSEYYRYRIPAGLVNVKVPVLLVAGRHEKMDVQPTNRLLSRLFPDNRAVLVGESRKTSAAQEHNWSVTWPELFAATVKSWIEHNPLPAGIVDMPEADTK